MAVNDDDGLRVTVEGPEPLVVELGPADSTEPLSEEHHRRIRVRAVSESAESRASGRRRYEAVVDGWVLPVIVESARRAELRERAARAAAEVGHHVGVAVRAQIPGRVVSVWVAPGDPVEAGQRLLAIEAMKMENEVRAPRTGVIGVLAVGLGQTVALGAELITLE